MISVSVMRSCTLGIVLLFPLATPLTFFSDCSKACRPDAACCSESECANNPHDDTDDGYKGKRG